MRRKYPNLERPYKLPFGNLVGILAAVGSLFILGIDGDPEFGLVAQRHRMVHFRVGRRTGFFVLDFLDAPAELDFGKGTGAYDFG